MTAPFQQHFCRLSTLSPVHLGCGEDYVPTNYVMRDQYLHAFSDTQLVHALGSAGLSRLAQLAEQGDESALLAIQREIHQKTECLIPVASHSVWVQSGIATLYNSRIGQVAQHEQRGRNVQNKLEIARTAYNPYDQLPLIPGSAIKGAIRTAWLDQQNAGVKALPQEKSGDLQKCLLDYHKVEQDPFYLLKISDAPYRHELPAGEIWYAVSRKRNPESKHGPASIYQQLECIGAGRRHAFLGDLRFLDGQYRNTSQCVPKTLEELATACNRYYLTALRKSLYQLGEQAGYFDPHWHKTLSRLLEGELGQALESNRAILLRLGRHSGAEDKTLDGVRTIKILTGKKDGKQTSEYRPNTTEIRLAAADKNQQNNLQPFGWVLLEFSDAPLPETYAALDELAAPARQRLPQYQAWAELRHKAGLEQSHKAAEEQERQARKAAEQQAEQQRQAFLEALPESQRKIENFKQKLEQDSANKGKGLGSPLGQELRERVQEALTSNWSESERTQLRALMATCFQHLGVDRKKNAKAKELWQTLA